MVRYGYHVEKMCIGRFKLLPSISSVYALCAQLHCAGPFIARLLNYFGWKQRIYLLTLYLTIKTFGCLYITIFHKLCQFDPVLSIQL